MPAPDGFIPLDDPGPFLEHVGPVLASVDGTVLGLQAAPHHLNSGGTVMGGLLATLVDAALAAGIRQGASDDVEIATVSLTTDYLRAAPAEAWLEASTEVERLGGRLAFADCSVRADGEECVRARAVFAVRS
jgi:uncharacterized protein (TIGR00369 family)